jgi:hypothetical protein
METLPTPRIENINYGQIFQVIEKFKGQEIATNFRSYEDAKKYYNTL